VLPFGAQFTDATVPLHKTSNFDHRQVISGEHGLDGSGVYVILYAFYKTFKLTVLATMAPLISNLSG